MRTKEEVRHEFNPVPPNQLTAGQKMAIVKFTAEAEDFAADLLDFIPEGAHRTWCVRQLLLIKFTGIQAITHGAAPEAALVKKETPHANTKPETKPEQKDQAPGARVQDLK
jgi:hypothetical protein